MLDDRLAPLDQMLELVLDLCIVFVVFFVCLFFIMVRHGTYDTISNDSVFRMCMCCNDLSSYLLCKDEHLGSLVSRLAQPLHG